MASAEKSKFREIPRVKLEIVKKQPSGQLRFLRQTADRVHVDRESNAITITRYNKKKIDDDEIVPTDQKDCKNVTEVTINNSKELEELPESLSNFTNLEKLDISGLPNIKRPLPPSIWKCKNLKMIWAIDTPLRKAFPPMLTMLMETKPQVITRYGISDDALPELREMAIRDLEDVAVHLVGGDYNVYSYLQPLLESMRGKNTMA